MPIFGSVEPFLYIIIFVTKSQLRHHVGCVFIYGQVSTPYRQPLTLVYIVKVVDVVEQASSRPYSQKSITAERTSLVF